MIKAVIFDATVIKSTSGERLAKLEKVINRFQRLGIQIIIVSTHPTTPAVTAHDAIFQSVDLSFTKGDIGVNKGSPAWVTVPADHIEAQPHEMLYVGDDVMDWRSAVNGGCFFVHALWSKPLDKGETAVALNEPERLWAFASHFLLHPPRWQVSLDVPKHRLKLRSLLEGNTVLPCDPGLGKFSLKDVFTFGKDVRVGGSPARDLLLLHTLASARLEGLIPPRAFVCLYPGHLPGTFNAEMQSYVEITSRAFGTLFKSDLLERNSPAPDTSLERAKGRPQNATFAVQANSVRVNPKYTHKITNKPVIVLDEFTTAGNSFEWARLLLLAAGAESVTLISVGKFSQHHALKTPLESVHIHPFGGGMYRDEDFETDRRTIAVDQSAPLIVQQSLEARRDGRAYPLSQTSNGMPVVIFDD